ncbi:unnamed protein product [Linum trigynum]|uniref:Uncharacterized protein n=1 Tax=Linum trigynum TaxID=586398 RepID=A0AAV2FTL0_9ROSI
MNPSTCRQHPTSQAPARSGTASQGRNHHHKGKRKEQNHLTKKGAKRTCPDIHHVIRGRCVRGRGPRVQSRGKHNPNGGTATLEVSSQHRNRGNGKRQPIRAK